MKNTPTTSTTRREFLSKCATIGCASASLGTFGTTRSIARERDADDLLFMSATEMAARIREKEISSVELITAHLEHIDRVDPGFNAMVQIADNALARAQAADEALARGENWGPLHGTPFAASDILDTEGVISTAGTLGRANFVPETDATVVARLKAAGAILLGKTNVPELAGDFFCENRVYGRTGNPYNPIRSPGSGAAASVSAGEAAFAVDVDGAGGLRFPAHWCGVCSIYPTRPRVSTAGMFVVPNPLASTAAIGPIARRVEDLWTLLNVMQGADERDPRAVDEPLGALDAVDFASLRISYFTNNGSQTADQRTSELLLRAANALEDVAASVDQDQPSLQSTWSTMLNVLTWNDTRAALDAAGTSLSEAADYTQSGINWAENNRVSQAAVRNNLGNYQRSLETSLAEFDITICPVVTMSDVEQGSGNTVFLQRLVNTWPFSLIDRPVAVVPVGVSAGGMPVGLQIVGKPWREDQVLAVARYLEQRFCGYRRGGIYIEKTEGGIVLTRIGGRSTRARTEVGSGRWRPVRENPIILDPSEEPVRFFSADE